MKTRRIVATILAVALIVALSTSALAAKFDLGKPNWVNRVEQQGWATDNAETNEPILRKIGLTVEQLQSATKLVLEFNSPSPEASPKLGVTSDSTDWKDWDAAGYLSDDLMKFEVDLAKDANWKERIIDDDIEWASFEVQAWNDNWLDLKSAYLEIPGDAAPGGGGGGSNPKTGDDLTIFLAIGALALAGVCGFVFYRKAKGNA